MKKAQTAYTFEQSKSVYSENRVKELKPTKRFYKTIRKSEKSVKEIKELNKVNKLVRKFNEEPFKVAGPDTTYVPSVPVDTDKYILPNPNIIRGTISVYPALRFRNFTNHIEIVNLGTGLTKRIIPKFYPEHRQTISTPSRRFWVEM